jgi:hypothetical protein
MLAILAAVDFDEGIEAAPLAEFAQATNLRKHFGQERLAAEAGIDGHDHDDVTEMEDVFDGIKGAGWVQHHPRLLAELVDLGQHPMQMEGRRRFGVHEKVIGARLGKTGDVAFRLDDH